MPSTERWPDFDFLGIVRLSGAKPKGISINRSGDGRCARLECEAYRVQVNELGVGRKIQEIDGLRQQEHRRCRE
jgi:hypothetical protein